MGAGVVAVKLLSVIYQNSAREQESQGNKIGNRCPAFVMDGSLSMVVH